MVSCAVTAVAFGAAGFYFGHHKNPEESPRAKPLNPPPGAPTTPTAPAKPPEAEKSPSTPPEATPKPEPVKPPQAATPPQQQPTPPEPVKLDADGTLKAFLAAPDWKARSRYVIVPDQVSAEMEKRAKASGDGPIQITGSELLFIQGGNHIYNIKTKVMPEGIPITLLATDDGPKVDWEAFISFYDDDFRKFSEGPVGSSGIFPLVVRPDPPAEGEKESHFMRFRVFPPLPNREQLAWVRKDSTVMPKLQAIFDGTGHLDKDKVKQQVSQGGIPMVLGLEKKSNGVGQTFLEITKYEALGWGPRHEIGKE